MHDKVAITWQNAPYSLRLRLATIHTQTTVLSTNVFIKAKVVNEAHIIEQINATRVHAINKMT